ncbi:MAG: Lsa family ABC-F type ribosomal protection protein [Lachnospiraceae bacterium]|uniref:Lsa family ABC-F type ribosomal protection protein n=1 Tax=Mediterraneibacter glycyrrhizinilyticus TaxID=342942 RepID=UPI00189D719E|nr:Lsa family ABC-F type ribosomal protection protein [Mediterraneibacter glycyrrhizinilyticus]MBS5325540.1 Lsa family ABC-F type ribosomal protection protein [Lachnospiraceae bacterium]
MSMIKVEDLTFSYPSSYDLIFDRVSFQIDTDWKLGFVGRNGRGKTTFLNLLSGKYEYRGKITSNVRFDYFPYPITDKERQTADILQEICPDAKEWEIRRELSYLDVEMEVLWRAFETLSNGEQTKVLLAALFLNEGNFLLIDEPTNHLDTAARKKVSEYLNRKKGFILVSHDRRFLDGCVDHILSINRTDIEVQSGNFSSWMENFERRQESELLQNERLKKDIGRLQKSAERSAGWSDRVEASKIGAADKGYVGHKSAKMMKRSKTIEKRKQQAIEQKAVLLKNVESVNALKMNPESYHSDMLVSFSEAAVIYEDRVVSRPVSFQVRTGDRVFIEGKNGSGKSSLLKLLVGEPPEHTGIVTVGSGLRISYVPQDTSYLTGTLEEFAEKNNLEESLFKTVLRKMDFERVQFEKDMKEFSGGQKKKVLIAKSLCERAHLYVWDEPLNFIDVYSRMQIEQLIEKFSPTMLLVEHDMAFRDAVATKVIEI